MPPATTRVPLQGYFLGRRPYAATLDLMVAFLEARKKGQIGDSVLLLEHEPVITLGRGAVAEHLLADERTLEGKGINVVKTGRGGDITLHAPGQLVAYPIIDLSKERRDVRRYVQDLTEAMRRVVLPFGIGAGTLPKMIGLWVDAENVKSWPGQESARSPAKLGAIGVRISRWVTSHGFALNLTTDLAFYGLIVPCGISEYPVASVKSLTKMAPDLKKTAESALFELNEMFGSGSPRFLDVSKEPLNDVLRESLGAL